MNPHTSTADSEVRAMTPIHPQGTIKAPASPHTKEAGGAERDGHPGTVEARGGGGRAEEGMGG